MSVLLYDLSVQGYFLLIKLAAFFNEKARLWNAGREGIFEHLHQQISEKRKPEQSVVWVHCASLGEFEQGRPVIEKIRTEQPEVFILLTFFSPSGFEVRKNYPQADLIAYLPADGRINAQRFIEIVKPDVAIFVKYEFWFHYLRQLNLQETPTFLIAATFRSNQPFFQWWGSLHRKMLACFTKIMVQQEGSSKLLHDIGIAEVEVCGDPRVDRVQSIAARPQRLPLVENFCGKSPVFICGSTWPADEKCIHSLLKNPHFSDWKIVIAPHDISSNRLESIERLFHKSLIIRYAELSAETDCLDKRILLIDNIGMLASLYQFGKVAYIGGGFGAGIHNILEPMAFGLPVVFGPKYQKFTEAKQAISEGCGYSIESPKSFTASMQQISQEEKYLTSRRAAFAFMEQNKGATAAIYRVISSYLK